MWDYSHKRQALFALQSSWTHTVRILQTVQSFEVCLQTGQVNSCLSTSFSFSWQMFFCFFVFNGCKKKQLATLLCIFFFHSVLIIKSKLKTLNLHLIGKYFTVNICYSSWKKMLLHILQSIPTEKTKISISLELIQFRGWLNEDFHPGLKFQLGIANWKKFQNFKFQWKTS